MALEDSMIVTWVVDYTFLPGLYCFLFYLVAKHFSKLRTLWYAFVLRSLPSLHDKYTERVKATLLSGLHDIVSGDWRLRNLGVIRILEIGPGVGRTFQFYPKNCRLIVYEPNPFVRTAFEGNKKKHPEIRMEYYVQGGAEDIAFVPDCSVDAVVSVHVLCAVKDLRKTLREIHRVLVPNGQFFYLEHTCHLPHKSWKSIVQKLLNPLWSVLFGCNINRNIALHIKGSRFSDVHQYQECRRWGRLLGVILHPTLIGIATK